MLWMQTVMLRYGGEAERDAVMRELDAAGIETRPVFYPMHLLPPYREDRDALSERDALRLAGNELADSWSA